MRGWLVLSQGKGTQVHQNKGIQLHGGAIIFFLCYRILTKVNESYNGTFLKQPNVSSEDPNYDTVTTSDEAVGDYDVIDNIKPKPRALQISNPPPVTVEASN